MEKKGSTVEREKNGATSHGKCENGKGKRNCEKGAPVKMEVEGTFSHGIEKKSIISYGNALL